MIHKGGEQREHPESQGSAIESVAQTLSNWIVKAERKASAYDFYSAPGPDYCPQTYRDRVRLGLQGAAA